MERHQYASCIYPLRGKDGKGGEGIGGQCEAEEEGGLRSTLQTRILHYDNKRWNAAERMDGAS